MAMHPQKLYMEAELARDDVEDRCTPDKMTKTEAKEFLETVISHLRTCLECLGEEMANEEG